MTAPFGTDLHKLAFTDGICPLDDFFGPLIVRCVQLEHFKAVSPAV